MSRNEIGPMDNGKVPRDSAVVPEESPRYRESSRTNLPVPVLRLKSLKFLQTQYDNYDYDAPESR